MTPLVFLTLALSGTPESLPEGAYAAADDDTYTTEFSGEANERPWWLAFDDPMLHDAISRALANNYDVKAAAERIIQAEATALQRLSPLLPRLTADASGSFSNASALGFQFGGFPGGGIGAIPTREPTFVFNASAALNARWTLDIWGQSYLAYRAADLQAKANEGDRDAVSLALANQVAAAYFDVVLAKQSISVVEEQVEANSRLLELL
ncbi:MAG: TolC family protein, partial [Myxococcota bacterium]